MANSFSILQLPIEEQLHVIQCMDSRSLLFFSLLSQNTKSLAKSLQREPSTVSVRIGSHICYTIHQYGFAFYTDENVQTLQKPSKVWMSQEYDSGEWNWKILSTHLGIKDWVVLISDIFNTREVLDMIFIPESNTFNVEAVKDVFGSCKSLKIVGSRPESQVKSILNTFTPKVEELKLCFNPFSLGESELRTTLLQNIKTLELGYYDNFERFTLNDLLACNASYISLNLNENFEHTNQFLKLWMKGANPRLQNLSIERVNGNVLRGIKVAKWIATDEDIVRNNAIHSEGGRAERTAVDIHRFDGSGATKSLVKIRLQSPGEDSSHYYVVDTKKEAIEILKEGTFDSNRREVLGRVSDDVHARLGKLKHVMSGYDTNMHLYCPMCDRAYVEGCKLHPMYWVTNIPKTQGNQRVPYAIRSTPPEWFRLSSRNTIAGRNQRGIKATRKIPVGLVFGPYLGTTTTDRRCENPHYSWWINGKKMTIDGYDQNISNWLRFVNSPNEETGANIKAIEYQGNIYYITIKVIQEKEEALVWYGPEYGEELRIMRENRQ
ncbi:unnamed protein product [Caenorhabditis brenneri]